MWRALKQRLQKRRYDLDEEFEQSIIDVWNGIGLKIVNRLIDSMPERMAEVVNHRGQLTQW